MGKIVEGQNLNVEAEVGMLIVETIAKIRRAFFVRDLS
jgi:hypothetical protein